MKKLAAIIAILFAGACASVPPSREKPQIGCWFDDLRRFDYVLVIERDDAETRFIKRQILTATPNRIDTEERTVPTKRVRLGYCPDEQQYHTDGRSPWAQPKGEER